jgi:hypothetical protein
MHAGNLIHTGWKEGEFGECTTLKGLYPNYPRIRTLACPRGLTPPASQRIEECNILVSAMTRNATHSPPWASGIASELL